MGFIMKSKFVAKRIGMILQNDKIPFLLYLNSFDVVAQHHR